MEEAKTEFRNRIQVLCDEHKSKVGKVLTEDTLRAIVTNSYHNGRMDGNSEKDEMLRPLVCKLRDAVEGAAKEAEKIRRLMREAGETFQQGSLKSD